jgi:capsular exopolysaccharide synthesis family protein
MDLAQYVRVFRAHWLLITLFVLITTGGAGAIAWTKTPTYSARTQLFVATSGSSVADLGQTYQGGLFSQQRVRSYAQIVDSPAVARAVISQLRLPETVEQLQSEIRATVPTDTVLINVTVEHPSRQRAKAIADAAAAHFSRFVSALETRQGEESSPVKVSVTSEAQLPTDPVSPRKLLYLLLGGLLGVVLGIGGAVLREALSTRIRAEDDAAAIADAPVLGGIANDRHAGREPLVVMSDPSSVRAEAYRRLRTNIHSLGVEDEVRSFVVSSAIASEGKTLIAANLGIVLAQAGHRVVLVDADLRRPRLDRVLALPSDVGLTNVLAEDLPIEDALRTWRDELPLEVILSGPQPPNPSELLGSQRLRTVLEVLKDRARVVILDAPALLPVTDAAILARATSGVLLVACVASTRAAQLAAAVQSVRAADGHVLGVVLNRLPNSGAWQYGGSRYAPDPRVDGGRRVATDAPVSR